MVACSCETTVTSGACARWVRIGALVAWPAQPANTRGITLESELATTQPRKVLDAFACLAFGKAIETLRQGQ